MEKGVSKMTADAKIGLLLGLFFIVIIAFLVNGLPNFVQREHTSPASATIATPTGPDIVLDNSISGAVHRLYEPRQSVQPQHESTPEIVVLDNLPQGTPQVEIPEILPQPANPIIAVNTPPASPAQAIRTHVVGAGDTLPVIAKKHYGPEDGNRRVVIKKLYELNSDVLKSPDRVRVGDTLKVPATVSELLGTADKVVLAPQPSKGLTQTLSDFFKPVTKKDAPSVAEYTVRQGDDLWSIAEQHLGAGSRYKDIQKLNAARIKNENNIPVGTRLILPAQ
jgi:LysM repeat protein